VFIALFSGISHSQHFSTVWSGNPFQPMNIIIQEATISNIEIPINAKDVSSGMYFIKVSYLYNGKQKVILRKLVVNK